MPDKIFSANGEFSFGAAEYKEGEQPDFVKIDRDIRHMQTVENACDLAAYRLLGSLPPEAEGLFRVYRRGGPSRYRAYVGPVTGKSVEEEFNHSYLLKAALNMEGK